MSQILITEQQLERLSHTILREQSVAPRETFNSIQIDLNSLLTREMEVSLLNEFSLVIDGLDGDKDPEMTVTIGGADITLYYKPPNARKATPEWKRQVKEPIYGRRVSTKDFITKLIKKDSSYGDFFKNYPEVKDQIETGTVDFVVNHHPSYRGGLIFSIASSKKSRALKKLPRLGHEFNLGTFYNNNSAVVGLTKIHYGELHAQYLSYRLTSLVLKEPDWGGEVPRDDIGPITMDFNTSENFDFNRATLTPEAINQIQTQILTPISQLGTRLEGYINRLEQNPIALTAFASRDDDPAATDYNSDPNTKRRLYQPCANQANRGAYNQCLSAARAQAVVDHLTDTAPEIFGNVAFRPIGGGENIASGNQWVSGKTDHDFTTTRADRNFIIDLPAWTTR